MESSQPCVKVDEFYLTLPAVNVKLKLSRLFDELDVHQTCVVSSVHHKVIMGFNVGSTRKYLFHSPRIRRQ